MLEIFINIIPSDNENKIPIILENKFPKNVSSTVLLNTDKQNSNVRVNLLFRKYETIGNSSLIIQNKTPIEKKKI